MPEGLPQPLPPEAGPTPMPAREVHLGPGAEPGLSPEEVRDFYGDNANGLPDTPLGNLTGVDSAYIRDPDPEIDPTSYEVGLDGLPMGGLGPDVGVGVAAGERDATRMELGSDSAHLDGAVLAEGFIEVMGEGDPSQVKATLGDRMRAVFHGTRRVIHNAAVRTGKVAGVAQKVVENRAVGWVADAVQEKRGVPREVATERRQALGRALGTTAIVAGVAEAVTSDDMFAQAA